MRHFLLSFSPKAQLVIIIFGTILVAFIASITVHLAFISEELTSKLGLITSIYTVLGTIYAVLIAFAVSGVWQNYCNAEMTVAEEVAALNDLVHMVKSTSLEKTEKIRRIAIEYIQMVLSFEWPMLAKGKNSMIMEPSSKTFLLSMDLVREIQTIQPVNERENVVFSHMLTLLIKWLDARRKRVIFSQGNIAKSLWPLLIAGAFILFAFHGTFVIHDRRLWSFLLLFFSGLIGLSFYLIFTLDAPFSGVPSIDSAPLRWALDVFKRQEQ